MRPPAGALAGVRDPHVTLCFLGEVGDERVGEVAAALASALAGVAACEARVEAVPARRLGPSALVRPVSGLDELAAVVRGTVGRFAARPEHRRFRGHLTVARHRRGGPAPSEGQVPRETGEQGSPAELRWRVDEVVLVRSHLGRGPGGTAHHEVVATVPLALT